MRNISDINHQTRSVIYIIFTTAGLIILHVVIAGLLMCLVVTAIN